MYTWSSLIWLVWYVANLDAVVLPFKARKSSRAFPVDNVARRGDDGAWLFPLKKEVRWVADGKAIPTYSTREGWGTAT